jgi:predicted Zn-dependent protease
VTSRILALCLASVPFTLACVSPAREAQLGDEAAQQVEEQMGLVQDSVPLGYVQAIGNRLAAVSDRPEGPWSFQIADQPEPNAFALPGGHVYVTRGLLALVNSEDELAGVIGHEIGHVTARHSAKRMSAGVLTAPVSIASAIASAGVGIVSPTLANVVQGTGSLVTGGLVLAPYGRSQENEADQIGQRLAAKAGYDAAGIATFMRTLKREGELRTSEKRRFHIMDTHPMPADRAKRTRERARTLKRAETAPIAGSTSALFAKLAGLLVGPDPAHGVFRESQFLHPELDLELAFPDGWTTANTPEAAGAVSPAKDAIVALRLAATKTTLDEVVEKAQAEQKGLTFERSTIHGLPAARARLASRGQAADITLVGHGGNVYSIAGQSAEPVASTHAPAFRRTAGSFRALRSSQRREIRESRLRVQVARAGESPADLAKRTGSSWSAAEIALANGIEEAAHFEGGRRVKVAVPQAYSR